MTLDVRQLSPDEIEAVLEDVARLRIEVFREWPYLYDGDLNYEKNYLAPYAKNELAVLVGAFDGPKLVGVSTGIPLLSHDDDFAEAFSACDIDLTQIFYFAESVLSRPYRGQGLGHQFFDLREDAARRMGFKDAVFCAVRRPSDHPARPSDYRPLDMFWRAKGFSPLTGVTAHFSWKDVGVATETVKPLDFWRKPL